MLFVLDALHTNTIKPHAAECKKKLVKRRVTSAYYILGKNMQWLHPTMYIPPSIWKKTEFCRCCCFQIIILKMPQGAHRKPKKTFLMIVGTSTENELLFKVGSFWCYRLQYIMLCYRLVSSLSSEFEQTNFLTSVCNL